MSLRGLLSRILPRGRSQGHAREECCAAFEWAEVAELGSARGIDFALGRCAACGHAWLRVWYYASVTYTSVTNERAQELLSLRETPDALRVALREMT